MNHRTNRIATTPLCRLMVGVLATMGLVGPAQAQPATFSFGVIARSLTMATDASALRDALTDSDADNLAFVVANGIKASNEPCTDTLYEQRKVILQEAKNGVVLSLTASDWSACTNTQGRSAAIDRLTRLRDLFFTGEFSLGATRIPVLRQSAMPKFRSYVENVRWEVGDVLFATINIPADNNHYLTDAGRNSEFEDRIIANKDWLQRLHLFASQKKLAGIVLFCDGNPLREPDPVGFFSPPAKRDGFAETRQMIEATATKYAGKILVIHAQNGTDNTISKDITWNNNLGHLDVNGSWLKLTVNATGPTLFSVQRETVEARNEIR